MDFQFVIPCTNADLLNSEGDNYYVKQVYDAREILEQLRICKHETLKGNPFYIFDHFDAYFSVIENAKNLSVINLTRSFDLLYLTCDKLGSLLASFLSGNEALVESERNSHLNLTKMVLFLITGTIKAIDQVFHKSNVDNVMVKKNKKNAAAAEGFEGVDWEVKRYKGLLQLFNFLQLPLEKLWNPPVAEETFIGMICETAYRTLEVYTLKDQQIGDTVFQILGTAIKRYNHALTFPIRILQILRVCENALAPTANGVFLLYEQYGISTVFSVLFKDIIETLKNDSPDSQISRNFSTFLTELGTVAPKVMIPHISTLGEELLNLESHVLRNCILQIMGDVVVRELTSEDLSEDLKETRNEFLEDLLAHINDVSAHVRSKVLQIWNHMKEENAVPLAYQHKVLKGSVERLEDKTSSVRKSAIILIKSFLEGNPFAPKLSLSELIKRYEEECEKLQKLRNDMVEQDRKACELDKHWETVIPELQPIVEEMLHQSTQEHMNSQENYEDLINRISQYLTERKFKEAVALAKQADFQAGNSELRITLKFEEQVIYYIALLKSYLFLSNGCQDKNEEFVTQENTVKFLEDSIEFSKIITKAVPKLQELLMSKINSDVFEAVNLFTTGYLFGIKGTESGIRRMLYLVWSGDKEKRDAVLNAYKKILFTTDQQGRSHALKVVQNLCALFEDLTYGNYSAMEVLIKEWVDNGHIDPQIIQVLFERFTMKLEGTTENESRQSLQLLIMASNAKSSIAIANINVIETIAFEGRAKNDPRLYIGCLSFLLNSIPNNLKSKYYKRYEEDHVTVQKVFDRYINFFFIPQVENFDDISTKTIEYFYQLCQSPDIVCQKLIIDLSEKLKENMKNKSYFEDVRETEITQSQNDVNCNAEKNYLPSFLLSRLIHLVGMITMKEMTFLDIDVYNNMKYREDLKEEKKNMKKKKGNKRKTLNLDMSASESLKRLSGTAAEPQQEPDEDLVGATAEDSIAELINDICENELLFNPKGLLAKFSSILIEVCKYPTKYRDETLQQAACLSLIRFMSVSSKFCEIYIPFLMNILNQTNNITIKCNIVVGLSDLTFRFPNILEPWTGHFYSTLHEKNDELRLTAVKMLSHLISHEMIRVKGQISDVALCIVDSNEEIRNITQQFFKEIANKSNILYNVLPDIISKLSDVNMNIEEGKYHIIMRHILGLIQKDRQVESLVEKLCLRFCVTHEERQWRDIAFCLSLLNYNERSIKKLTDNIQYYKDKVQVNEVYQSFKTIIANTSKLAKPELKVVITEFENRLAECLQVREEGDSPVNNFQQPSTSKGKKSAPMKANQKNRRGRKVSTTESSSEDEEIVRPIRNKMENVRLSNRIANKQKNNVVVESSTTEDESPQPKKGRKRR